MVSDKAQSNIDNQCKVMSHVQSYLSYLRIYVSILYNKNEIPIQII